LAGAGVVPPQAGSEAYAPGEDLVGACATGAEGDHYGKPIVTRDPLNDTSHKFQRTYGSLLSAETEIAYVPLTGPNRTYGVIRCIGRIEPDGRPARLSDEDLNDLKVFTHQVAISISSLRRKVELDILAHVNNLLTDEPDNVARVYDLVTKALVAESTEFAACSIRIRDRHGALKLESLSSAVGVSMVEKDREPRLPDSGFARLAFESKEPVIISDVQARVQEFHDPDWLKENGYITAGIFPMQLNEENIGLLALYLWFPYDFYETKINFLKNVCQQVGTATRVVRLLTARQKLIERMNAIVSHPSSGDGLLSPIVTAAQELTGASQGYISLTSRRDSQLHPRVTTGSIDPSDIPAIDREGPGLTAYAVRMKQSVRCPDVTIDPMYVDFQGSAKLKTKSELVVPLLYEQHVLGVIALQSVHRQFFSREDELLLETLAQYATFVFQRDRLHAATQTLANVDFPRSNRTQVFSVTAKSATELVDADAAILRLYNPSTKELELEGYYPETVNVQSVARSMPRGVGACWSALETGDLSIVDNIDAASRFHNRDFAKANGYTEMVTVPLLLPADEQRSRVELGVINIFFHKPSPFFDIERRLLRALAVSASYAIHDLSIIEESNRTHALATITARTTAAMELSSRLARQTFGPLRAAGLAVEAIERALRRQDLIGIPPSLVRLQSSLIDLRALVTRLAPDPTTMPKPPTDSSEVLSDAFRMIHQRLFATSDRPLLNVSEEELWREIKTVLQRLMNLLQLPIAAAFLSTQRDYSDLHLKAVTREEPPAANSLALPSFEEFAWLARRNQVILPRTDGRLSWLDPKQLIGTHGAAIYGHELTGGKLVIIAVGFDAPSLSFEELATLYEAIVVQIFTHIDNAIFGIELDYLTSETGHLMGRAIGKVETGVRKLKQILTTPDSTDLKMLTLAQSAIEDGLIRLNLIHNNFYWFGAQRRGFETRESEKSLLRDREKTPSAERSFNVCAMLRDMSGLFIREATDRNLKQTKIIISERPAMVKGPEDLLRLTFLNLYDNAMKFAYANTFIVINAGSEDGVCRVIFENLGVGVAPDEVNTVFERLRRSRYQDTSKRIEGLGLGLSYCRRVVHDIFHGRISLISHEAPTPNVRRFEGDNWLTTVTVELPIADEGRDSRS
jgi:GAF domain-containing protein/signal transduction histidine kinase